jgi:hypothetical protein
MGQHCCIFSTPCDDGTTKKGYEEGGGDGGGDAVKSMSSGETELEESSLDKYQSEESHTS